jgi:hypothetical protein
MTLVMATLSSEQGMSSRVRYQMPKGQLYDPSVNNVATTSHLVGSQGSSVGLNSKFLLDRSPIRRGRRNRNCLRKSGCPRMSRYVAHTHCNCYLTPLLQLHLDSYLQFGEVQYFFTLSHKDKHNHEHFHHVAMLSIYSPPDAHLLDISSGTLWACRYQADQNLQVVDVKDIASVVGMPPLPHHPVPGTRFVAERVGLNIDTMGSVEEDVAVE